MISWAILALRIGLGVIFTAHGLQKAFGLFGGTGMINGLSSMLQEIGFRPAIFWAYLAAYVELIGGIFLVLGIFVRTSSVLLLILIAVAAIKVHLKGGFFLANGGIEYTFLIAAACISLIITGAGRFSLWRRF